MAEETGSVEAGNLEPIEQTQIAMSPEDLAPSEAAKPPSILDNFEDPELRSYAESKAFDRAGFEGVVKSYKYLEKMMTQEKAGLTITMLGDDPTPEERNTYFTKLGRPASAADYSVALPEGVTDDTRLTMMRNKAHELGISDAQFSGLAEADAAYLSATQQGMTDKAAVSAADAEAQLRTEWGAAFELKVASIDVAAHKLGMSEDHLNGLREAMGPVEAMKFVDGLNTKMGDHNFDEGEKIIPGHKTPEQAKEELDQLTMNKEFMDAWMDGAHPGHKTAVEKKASLARLVSGVV